MISVLDILYVSSDSYTIVHNNPFHSIVICEENPTCYVQEFQCKHPGAPQAWTRTQLMRCPRTSWHLCCACSHQQAAIWSGEWGGGKKMSGPWGLPKIDQFKFVHFRLFSGFKMFLDVLSHFKPTHHMKLQALAAIADPQETANSGRSWCPPTPQPPWWLMGCNQAACTSSRRLRKGRWKPCYVYQFINVFLRVVVGGMADSCWFSCFSVFKTWCFTSSKSSRSPHIFWSAA